LYFEKLTAGEIIGLDELLNCGQFSSSVISIENCDVCIIPDKDLENLISQILPFL
jgi:CRP-like cAMP-binding protein